MLKTLIIAFLVFGTVVGADEERKPGHCLVDGFNIKESDDYIPAPVGFCAKVKCEDASTNTHEELTCASHGIPAGCHETEMDLTKPYPRCCPKVICEDKSDSNESD